MTDNRWSAITPFFVGVAVGVAVAIFAAPKSGQQLRGDIVDKVNQGIKRGKETTRHLVSQATRVADQVEREVQRVKDAVDAGTQAYRAASNSSATHNS
jgi:gas vesicle protein